MHDKLIRALTADVPLPEELRERLVTRATADRALDVAYRVVDS